MDWQEAEGRVTAVTAGRQPSSKDLPLAARLQVQHQTHFQSQIDDPTAPFPRWEHLIKTQLEELAELQGRHRDLADEAAAAAAKSVVGGMLTDAGCKMRAITLHSLPLVLGVCVCPMQIAYCCLSRCILTAQHIDFHTNV